MVDKTDITNTLNELDLLYNSQPAQAFYYAKLALLELCGWIEQTMDFIIIDNSNIKLSVQANKSLVKDSIVKRTYGFHYDDHFRPMLMKLIGLIELEKLENNLKATGDFAILSSQLGSLRQSRDKAAHTTIAGATPSFEAPSNIKAYLERIYPIIQTIDTALRAI